MYAHFVVECRLKDRRFDFKTTQLGKTLLKNPKKEHSHDV